MKFTNLPAVAHFIDRHHSVFGCPIKTMSTLDVLGNLNRQIKTCRAVTGATYKAWLHVDGEPEMMTLITIEKNKDGFWVYTERPAN